VRDRRVDHLQREQDLVSRASGLFLEIMERIEADMQRKYGLPRPGNSFCAWTTCEAARITERFVPRACWRRISPSAAGRCGSTSTMSRSA